jgi:hypothetical protein
MQQFSAVSVFWAGSLIENVRMECYLASAASIDGKPLFALMQPIDERLRNKALKTLDSLEKDCELLGLNLTLATMVGLRSGLTGGSGRNNVQWLLDQMKAIRDLLANEMKGRVYAYIPPESARYFTSTSEPHLFGSNVDVAFPSAQYDIHEAGCCMAVVRPTAAVFHLMRVLECGLNALGKVFSVSLEHTNWAPAIEQIESRIRNMHKDPAWKSDPKCKELQVNYSQVAANFGVLKDAWRNHTMHGRSTYSTDEAEHIFNNTQFFMKKLAALGLTA